MVAKQRRAYRFREFVAAALAIAVRIPLFARALLRGRLSRAFKEKMMLTVTAVNGCRYCAWSVGLLAAQDGVLKEDIAALLSGSLGCAVSAEEAVGLAFAQHYAESGARPDAQALARLREAYNSAEVEEILLTLRWVTFFNLAGNSFRTFLERMTTGGFAAPGLWSELLVFLFTAPIFAPVALLTWRTSQQDVVGTEGP